jgi:hypothetical protein
MLSKSKLSIPIEKKKEIEVRQLGANNLFQNI